MNSILAQVRLALVIGATFLTTSAIESIARLARSAHCVNSSDFLLPAPIFVVWNTSPL